MSAKIAAALHEVMSKVAYVQKTGKNTFHGYKYAGEADILEKLRPAMIEAGLLLLPSVEHVSQIDEHGNTTVRVGYTLMHKDGEVWPEKLYAAGCGGDRAKNGNVGDKGVYKAITGANKYLLFKLFQIETGDDPEEGIEPNERPARHVEQPKQSGGSYAAAKGRSAIQRGPEGNGVGWKAVINQAASVIDAQPTPEALKAWRERAWPTMARTKPIEVLDEIQRHYDHKMASYSDAVDYTAAG